MVYQKLNRHQFHVRRRIALVSALIVEVMALVLVSWSDLSFLLRDQLTQWLPFSWLVLIAYCVVLGVVLELLALPFQWYSEWYLEHHIGLSKQTQQAWFVDHLKGLLILGVLVLLGLSGAYWSMGQFPRAWWVLMAGAVLVVFVGLVQLAPVVLLPMFFRCRPLAESDLQARLRSLAARCGTHLEGVYQLELSAKTTSANAALAGIGKTRRVLLGDTLLARFDHDEIEAIMAHELGHHARHHLLYLILVQTMTVGVVLAGIAWGFPMVVEWRGLQGLTDPAGAGWFILLFLCGSLLGTPIVAGVSRWCERQADRFALENIADPSVFARALKKISNQNASEEHPPAWIVWLVYTHPPMRVRLRAAQDFERQEQ